MRVEQSSHRRTQRSTLKMRLRACQENWYRENQSPCSRARPSDGGQPRSGSGHYLAAKLPWSDSVVLQRNRKTSSDPHVEYLALLGRKPGALGARRGVDVLHVGRSAYRRLTQQRAAPCQGRRRNAQRFTFWELPIPLVESQPKDSKNEFWVHLRAMRPPQSV